MWKTGILIFLLQGVLWSAQAQIIGDFPPITLAVSNGTVEQVLKEITRQTGIQFSYNPRSVDVQRRVILQVDGASLEEIMENLAAQTDISYRQIKGQIVLNNRHEPEKEPEDYFTLSGFIEDQSSGESLIGATAAVPGTSQGTITNAFGFYSLMLKRGPHPLNYSFIGYEKEDLQLNLQTDLRKDVAMKLAAIDLPNVVVEIPLQEQLEKKQLGQLELRSEVLNNMPEFAGESGLVKGLQSLPGVNMHSDGSAFFYVRGGERDQNLIIIDDAPIYNPSHLFGFYSIVIPEFAKSIEIYKSEVPASLGDRLSSIVSIRTKDGNLNRFQFSGSLNPLINRFSFEIPVVKQRGSVFLSWRRSNFEWLYKKAAPNADLGFGDFNFKINYKLNERNRVFFTTILSSDNFSNSWLGDRLEAGIRWANLAATLRWNHIFGPTLFSNTTLYTGNYGYRLFFSPNYWQSALGTLSFKTDFTHYAGPAYTARFGLESQAYFIDPGSLTINTDIAIFPPIQPNYSRKGVLYYQGEWEVSPQLKLSAGVRMLNWSNLGPATYYTFDEQHQVIDTIDTQAGVYNRYLRLDPRLSLQYQLDSTSQLKLSYGRYHQFLQLISNSESPFNSFEVWLPAGPNLLPQSATQWSLSYLKYLRGSGLELSASLYHKWLENQIDYQPHATTLLNPLVEGELRFGTMRSYGLELMLKKELGRFNGWLAYTYSRSLRQTPELNNGNEYPAFQDRPHDLSFLMNYQLSPRWLFSAYWTAYSGSTFSSPTGFYTYNDQTIPVYAEKNNDRLPNYQRLDLALRFRLNRREDIRWQHSLTFSLYNALAHKNIVVVNFNKVPVPDSRPVVKSDFVSEVPLSPSRIDLIRFFPSLTYKFKL